MNKSFKGLALGLAGMAAVAFVAPIASADSGNSGPGGGDRDFRFRVNRDFRFDNGRFDDRDFRVRREIRVRNDDQFPFMSRRFDDRHFNKFNNFDRGFFHD